jgi:hypothetical protein
MITRQRLIHWPKAQSALRRGASHLQPVLAALLVSGVLGGTLLLVLMAADYCRRHLGFPKPTSLAALASEIFS